MNTTLTSFTDVLVDEICNSQPLSLSSTIENSQINVDNNNTNFVDERVVERPPKGTGQRGQFRSIEEIDLKYRDVFSYPYFNLVQSSVIEDALYSDKSIVVCAPTGSGKTVIFEMAVVQLLMELENKQYTDDFKIIYMAPVKALCTERLTEWYSKFTKLGLLCIEVTGDTDVDFTQLKPYKVIITTPEKWDMLTRRWRDHRGLVEVIKLFLIDEVHILNDETRGPVLEAVVSRMKTIENSAQSAHRIEQLQKEMQGQTVSYKSAPRIRFVAVSATVSNPEDVANWLGTSDKPAVFYKFGDECRPVKLKRIVEGYPCSEGTSIFKFDIILNYKLWPVIQKYHSGKPTLIFCNTRKSVILTAETLSRELTISFNAEQKAKLTALASTIKNKKLQALVMSGVGCHHAGLLYEERQNIELAFRNRDLPILITTTTLAMGVNLPAHLVIVKNTHQYVNGAYQEYSISTVLQMVGRAGRPQFDTEATAVIMTRLVDKPRYQALVGGCEPLQSFLHKRLPENLNSEAALGTVGDVAQCVQWLRSTFLYVRAARDPKKYLGLPQNSPQHLISKKIEELCVKAMNGLASSGLITMDEASCIESTEAGRLMSIFYLDLETMKLIMKIEGTESLDRLLSLICESHELADMHLRVDERRCLNTLNRNNAAATIRFPMKGKISTRQMKLNCIIQAVLGCLPIPDPSLNQEAMKIMRIADRICKCVVTYVTRPDLITQQPPFYSAVLNSILLAKCVAAHLWENSPYVSKQLKGIGPTFSTLLASAGKVNFMLLEESHPRDLERIMNKGAPAGNVLRKQVSLLPKYQLTMIPVDEQTVTVQLVLLNQSYLSENMANLTAGDTHKSYIIVGDSNNHLLLLTAFKDKDLISVYGGTITREIRRKHNFEHKIIAHCISSTFVGIDVQSEYLFNDLEPFFGAPCTKTPKNDFQVKNKAEKQTCITDTFKERKRKNTDSIAQSKEKKKRETALIENFKNLKKSFESASKNVGFGMRQQSKENRDVDGTSNNNTNNTLGNIDTMLVNNNAINVIGNDKVCIEDMDSDEFIDNEKIDSILNEIESEMSKNKISKPKTNLNNGNTYFREKNYKVQENPFAVQHNLDTSSIQANYNVAPKVSNYKTACLPRKRKPTTTKSNYNFIDLLERNLSLSDDEDKTEVPQPNNGFSDAIKSQISKYLSKTKPVVPDRNLEMLLDNPQITVPSDNLNPTNVIDKSIDQDCEILDDSNRSPYPKYGIVEILGAKDPVKQHGNIQHTTYSKNNIENPDHQVCDIIDVNSINTNNYIDLTHGGTNTIDSAPKQNINNVITNNENSKNNIINSLDVTDALGVQTFTKSINEENFANNRLYIEDSGSENGSNKEDSEKVAKAETNSVTIARDMSSIKD
ncbi:probable ATP-dependent DNA helicase HFM1 [Helicoverpa zea]|uniref:probable ATP-dependent DNA helicase HFM1 n=1 Tax=Helicoverpa zea TaxID=7113 RepID=UPI001F58020C|nr:probable ATP-dependent DNA helicase HFM1 [Helicoverpa zea]